MAPRALGSVTQYAPPRACGRGHTGSSGALSDWEREGEGGRGAAAAYPRSPGPRGRPCPPWGLPPPATARHTSTKQTKQHRSRPVTADHVSGPSPRGVAEGPAPRPARDGETRSAGTHPAGPRRPRPPCLPWAPARLPVRRAAPRRVSLLARILTRMPTAPARIVTRPAVAAMGKLPARQRASRSRRRADLFRLGPGAAPGRPVRDSLPPPRALRGGGAVGPLPGTLPSAGCGAANPGRPAAGRPAPRDRSPGGSRATCAPAYCAPPLCLSLSLIALSPSSSLDHSSPCTPVSAAPPARRRGRPAAH